MSGNYSYDLEKVLENSSAFPDLSHDPKQEPVKSSKTISQVIDNSFKEGYAYGRWTTLWVRRIHLE